MLQYKEVNVLFLEEKAELLSKINGYILYLSELAEFITRIVLHYICFDNSTKYIIRRYLR